MKFTKMHGAGNDFIIINNMEEKIPVEELGELAKTLCNRRLSIGGDGFMAVDYPEAGGDFKMRFYNADGSLAEMCGNGARCIARYGWEKKLAGEAQKIETASGMVYGWRQSDTLYKIRLNDVSKAKLNRRADLLDEEGDTGTGVMTHLGVSLPPSPCHYEYAYIELGEPGLPHVVVRIPGLQSMEPKDLRGLGGGLRNHSAFPKGANVNFYDMIGENEITLLTFERGVEDFTLACGTGAGATVTALALMDMVRGENTKVQVPGGELFITAVKEGREIKELYLTGPTCLVAEGEVFFCG